MNWRWKSKFYAKPNPARTFVLPSCLLVHQTSQPLVNISKGLKWFGLIKLQVKFKVIQWKQALKHTCHHSGAKRISFLRGDVNQQTDFCTCDGGGIHVHAGAKHDSCHVFTVDAWILKRWAVCVVHFCKQTPQKTDISAHACSHTHPLRCNYIEIKKWEHTYCQCEFSKRSISVVIRSLQSWTLLVVFVGAVALVSTAELSLSQISLQVSALMAKRWTISKWAQEEIFL